MNKNQAREIPIEKMLLNFNYEPITYNQNELTICIKLYQNLFFSL